MRMRAYTLYVLSFYFDYFLVECWFNAIVFAIQVPYVPRPDEYLQTTL